MRPLHLEFRWPTGGVSDYRAFEHQITNKGQAPTCPDALNVRTYDATTGRMRGASRWGHSKYVDTQLNGSNHYQDLNHVVVPAAYSGATSMAVRTLKAVGVSGGTVKSFTSSTFNATTNGSGALSATAPFIDSAVFFGNIYYADGASTKFWRSSDDSIQTWTPSAGSLPSSGGNYARLACTWGGRIVLSGVVGDGQNWFMSKIGDPLDWDYGATDSAAKAVAGNNAIAGKCPDIINALIPYSDDLLIFGGDHSIYQMTGNPMAGGVIDRLCEGVGIAFGRAWCQDVYGQIWFFGSRGGVYRMTPGSKPERVSQYSIERRLQDVDYSTSIVRMAYDDRSQHVLLFITPLDGSETTHYAFDIRDPQLPAAWPDSFASVSHNPTAVHVLDGDDPTDRVVLLGCRDGYIRQIDEAAETDDGQKIESYVYLGPLKDDAGRVLRMTELELLLGDSSGPVRYGVYAGGSVREAYDATKPQFEGVWNDKRGYVERQRALGAAMYLRLEAWADCDPWQFETATCVLLPGGRAAARLV